MAGYLQRSSAFLLTPLLYANLAGLALGGLWLAAVGQWQVIWLGFLATLLSPYLIPLLLMPAGIFSYFMTHYHHVRHGSAERLMFGCSLAYVLLFITLWATGIFDYVQGATAERALYPALLWGATAALAPLLMWASRDRGNIFVTEMVELAQLAIIALVILRLFGIDLSFGASFLTVGGIMGFAGGAQAFYEKIFFKPRG